MFHLLDLNQPRFKLKLVLVVSIHLGLYLLLYTSVEILVKKFVFKLPIRETV